MGLGSSPAMQALRRAQAAAQYARRTGCDIGEATSVLSEPASGPRGYRCAAEIGRWTPA